MRGCTPQPVRGEETEARRGGVGARGPSWSAAPWLAGLRVGTASRLPFPPRMSFRLPSSCLRVPHLGNLTSPPRLHARKSTHTPVWPWGCLWGALRSGSWMPVSVDWKVPEVRPRVFMPRRPPGPSG